MAPTAVLHDAHTVGYDIATWMLHDLGYKVYAAGESFGRVLPEYRSNRYPPGNAFLTRKNGLPPWDGVVEIEDAPRDALFVDAFPSSEKALRDFGWEGPILYYWILPVGRNFIHEGRFRPGRKVGVVAFNRAVARLIWERNLCPVEFLLPPYDRAANFTVREDFEPYVVAAVNKVVDWAPLRTREMLKRPQTWAACAIALLILSPNIYWNVTHSFATLRHTGDNITGSGLSFRPLQASESRTCARMFRRSAASLVPSGDVARRLARST